MITEWARVDGEAAGTYLQQQPASVLRDAAVSAYVTVVATDDLQGIADWAAIIHDGNLREQILRRIAGHWMARNPQATLAWLAASGLSVEAQLQITGTREQER